MSNVLYSKVADQKRKQFEIERLAQLVKRKSVEELRAKNIKLAEIEETGKQEVSVDSSFLVHSKFVFLLSKAAEKRRKLIAMEKLAKLEERKKSAKYVKARRAAMAEKEQLRSTLYFGQDDFAAHSMSMSILCFHSSNFSDFQGS